MPNSFNADVKMSTGFRNSELTVDVELSKDDIVGILEDLEYNIRTTIAKDILDDDGARIEELVDGLSDIDAEVIARKILERLGPAQRDDVMAYYCSHCAERETIRYAVDEVEDNQ